MLPPHPPQPFIVSTELSLFHFLSWPRFGKLPSPSSFPSVLTHELEDVFPSTPAVGLLLGVTEEPSVCQEHCLPTDMVQEGQSVAVATHRLSVRLLWLWIPLCTWGGRPAPSCRCPQPGSLLSSETRGEAPLLLGLKCPHKTHMYTRVCTYTHTPAHHTHTHAHRYTIRLCAQLHVHTTYLNVPAHTHTSAHTHTLTCIGMHTHVHTHYHTSPTVTGFGPFCSCCIPNAKSRGRLMTWMNDRLRGTETTLARSTERVHNEQSCPFRNFV